MTDEEYMRTIAHRLSRFDPLRLTDDQLDALAEAMIGWCYLSDERGLLGGPMGSVIIELRAARQRLAALELSEEDVEALQDVFIRAPVMASDRAQRVVRRILSQHASRPDGDR